MKMQNTSTCFNITKDLSIEVSENLNHYGVSPSLYFDIATRINPKRSFLFVSKLLGKHLEVKPDIPKLSGYMLVNKYAELQGISDRWCVSSEILKSAFIGEDKSLMKKIFAHKLKTDTRPLVIGFAETATGLGHAVFSALEDAVYVHTTREIVDTKKSLFDFEEEHSHATSHMCYLEKSVLDGVDEIFLVDDEITTGNTAMNLIKSLDRVYPGKSYKVFALLDWRSPSDYQKYDEFIQDTGIDIEVISLYEGNIDIKKEKLLDGNVSPSPITTFNPLKGLSIDSISRFTKVLLHENVSGQSYIMETGRFGLLSDMEEHLERNAEAVGKTLKALRRNKKSVVIGSGELIYIPSRIASYMGNGVLFKSYTRSPIKTINSANYPINDVSSFVDDSGVLNHIYNMNGITEVFIITEQNMSSAVKTNVELILRGKGVENIVFVNLQ